VVIAVKPEDAKKAVEILNNCGEEAYIIGELTENNEKIELI
jgi:hydrogenase maturation factor